MLNLFVTKKTFLALSAIFIQFSRCLVGLSGLEPPTSRLSGVRSNRLSYKPIFPGFRLLLSLSQAFGGDKRDRTADPLLAKQVLSQLSYTPISLSGRNFTSFASLSFALLFKAPNLGSSCQASLSCASLKITSCSPNRLQTLSCFPAFSCRTRNFKAPDLGSSFRTLKIKQRFTQNSKS